MLFSSAEEGAHILLVTSAGPGEGKTLIAGTIAWSLAQVEQRVLLIDADMRLPRVHELIDCTQEPGLSDLLVGQCTSTEAVRSTRVPGLHLVTGGHIPPNPAELLGSRKFQEHLRILAKSYDWVIIDSPPVLAVTDPAVLSKTSTGVLFVVGADKTTKQATRTALAQLRALGAKLIGTVLNGADVTGSPYYYANYYRKDYARYYTGAVAPKASKSAEPTTTLGLRS